MNEQAGSDPTQSLVFIILYFIKKTPSTGLENGFEKLGLLFLKTLKISEVWVFF